MQFFLTEEFEVRILSEYEEILNECNGKVYLHRIDDKGISKWVIVAYEKRVSPHDGFWLATFNKRHEAIEFSERQGWTMMESKNTSQPKTQPKKRR